MNTRVLVAWAILLAGSLYGCTDGQRDPSTTASLAVRDSVVTVLADTCTDSTCSVSDCGGVDVRLVMIDGNAALAGSLLRVCSAFHVGILVGEDAPSDTVSVTSAGQIFLDRLAAFRRDFPESPGFWTMMGRDTAMRLDSLICIHQEAYTFTGGAHGVTTSRFVIVRARDGAAIPWSDLVEDTIAFRTAAEKAFRSAAGMKANETYASRGYWFENERFVLAREIGIDTSGFVLEYQHYEIAPYSMGRLRVHVPFGVELRKR
jgi:hypothetical protein